MPCAHWSCEVHTADSHSHTPVLLAEAVEALAVKPTGIYVDGTFGRGGHSRALLANMGPDGRLFALDKDPDAVRAGEELARLEPRFVMERASFSRLAALAATKWIVAGEGIMGRVDGVLLDLGVSSPQLTDPKRGFGFMADGPLDMRMDPFSGISATTWLAGASEREIVNVLKVYGEERYAKRIARAIVGERRTSPIDTTGRLAELVARASPSRERNKHPATRTFQAIRIHINKELDELEDALGQVLEVLAPGGRLVVISFHSLEDRLVKRFIRDNARQIHSPRGLPTMPDVVPPLFMTHRRPLRPSDEEVATNTRARSALLRCAQKSIPLQQMQSQWIIVC